MLSSFPGFLIDLCFLSANLLPMTPTEMRELLARKGIQLTKSLGQNFLHDAHQLQRIADTAELTREDKVLEIGPGLGPLTDLLLERAGEVLAIEKDARLVDFLRDAFELKSGSFPKGTEENQESNDVSSNEGSLGLLHDDALDLLKRDPRDWSDWKVVSNLPFSVASPILVELSRGEQSPKRIVVTLQLEVANRLMAKADDDDYGLLSLLVQLDFEPRDSFKIPSSCFFPEPNVDSACICLVRRSRQLLSPERRKVFYRVVKRAFSQRRKMMMKLLKQDWTAEKLTQAFERLQISPLIRAEAVSLEQFVELTGLLLD
jgi:16S rRNA (adenine1518-N6/adenine1519-N6)-dimethyltransferase